MHLHYTVQCVAVRCGVLQCVAARCIVLQCVAVCCSVLYYSRTSSRAAMEEEEEC